MLVRIVHTLVFHWLSAIGILLVSLVDLGPWICFSVNCAVSQCNILAGLTLTRDNNLIIMRSSRNVWTSYSNMLLLTGHLLQRVALTPLLFTTLPTYIKTSNQQVPSLISLRDHKKKILAHLWIIHDCLC